MLFKQKQAYRIDEKGQVIQVGNVQNSSQLNAGRVVLPGTQESFGSVVDVGSSDMLNFFNFECDNSLGLVPVDFFIGAEVCRLMIDAALAKATGVSVPTVVFERAFEVAAVGVKLINLLTSSNPAQYKQPIKYYHDCELNGATPFQPLAMPLVQRNNQFQLDIQTIKPSGGNIWRLDWQGGFVITVLAGEVLQVAMEPGELQGR